MIWRIHNILYEILNDVTPPSLNQNKLPQTDEFTRLFTSHPTSNRL